MRNLGSTTSSRFVGGNCVFQCSSFFVRNKMFQIFFIEVAVYFLCLKADFAELFFTLSALYSLYGLVMRICNVSLWNLGSETSFIFKIVLQIV
jgi:hypothetical protein